MLTWKPCLAKLATVFLAQRISPTSSVRVVNDPRAQSAALQAQRRRASTSEVPVVRLAGRPTGNASRAEVEDDGKSTAILRTSRHTSRLVTHTRFGSDASNRRLSTFGAIGREWLESVVVFRETATTLSRRETVFAHQPLDSLLADALSNKLGGLDGQARTTVRASAPLMGPPTRLPPRSSSSSRIRDDGPRLVPRVVPASRHAEDVARCTHAERLLRTDETRTSRVLFREEGRRFFRISRSILEPFDPLHATPTAHRARSCSLTPSPPSPPLPGGARFHPSLRSAVSGQIQVLRDLRNRCDLQRGTAGLPPP